MEGESTSYVQLSLISGHGSAMSTQRLAVGLDGLEFIYLNEPSGFTATVGVDNGYPNAAFSTDFVQPLREVLVVKRKLQYRKGNLRSAFADWQGKICKYSLPAITITLHTMQQYVITPYLQQHELVRANLASAQDRNDYIVHGVVQMNFIVLTHSPCLLEACLNASHLGCTCESPHSTERNLTSVLTFLHQWPAPSKSREASHAVVTFFSLLMWTWVMQEEDGDQEAVCEKKIINRAFLSLSQITALTEEDVEGVQKKLEEYLKFKQLKTSLKEAILLDYYTAGFCWAKEMNFRLIQLSGFMDLLNFLLENLSDKHMSLGDNLKELGRAMAGIGETDSKGSGDLYFFSIEQAKAVIDYLNIRYFCRIYYFLFE
ncbi:hypothetical protein Q9233_009993 [Columba guinea]|nr:hypothetical protein Q9233_009993 [Columba guinea]